MRSQASRTEFGEEQMRSLGMRLRELREARSWSLRRLALESEVSTAAIQKIELGETNPSLLTVLALAEALGEPVDRLVAVSLANSVASNFTHGVLPDTSGELKTAASGARLGSRLMVIAARRSMTPPGPEHPRFFFRSRRQPALQFFRWQLRDSPDWRRNACSSRAVGALFKHAAAPQPTAIRP